jgi:hypothetical protein
MGNRRTRGATRPPALVGWVEPMADEVPANHATPLPYWARNRVQRVPDRRCPICGAEVRRAHRGPTPRCCISCELGLRRVRQLRAYLRAAERLADALGRPEVAEAARVATRTLDDQAGQS